MSPPVANFLVVCYRRKAMRAHSYPSKSHPLCGILRTLSPTDTSGTTLMLCQVPVDSPIPSRPNTSSIKRPSPLESSPPPPLTLPLFLPLLVAPSALAASARRLLLPIANVPPPSLCTTTPSSLNPRTGRGGLPKRNPPASSASSDSTSRAKSLHRTSMSLCTGA